MIDLRVFELDVLDEGPFGAIFFPTGFHRAAMNPIYLMGVAAGASIGVGVGGL